MLSAEDATELYRCFLKDTLALMESVAETEIMISYTPEGAESYFDSIRTSAHRLLPQRGEGLGDRVYNALADLLSEGFHSVAIMNADSPTLPRQYIEQAFEELAKPGDRVVLGPTSDGGYYLIGIKRPHRRLFEDITWSSESVLAETLERAREIALDAVLLPEWYDVDSVEEFERLKRDVLSQEDGGSRTDSNAALAANTRRFILSR